MHYAYLEFSRSLMSPGSGPSSYTWDTYSAPTMNDREQGDRLARIESTLSTLVTSTREHEQRISSLESRAESFEAFHQETGISARGGRKQQRRAAPEDSEDLSDQTGTLSKAAKQAKLMLQVS